MNYSKYMQGQGSDGELHVATGGGFREQQKARVEAWKLTTFQHYSGTFI